MSARFVRNLLLTGLTLLTAGRDVTAQTTAPDWENEAVFRINKEAPHAVKMPFPTAKGAVANERLESPWCRVLNGDWKFHWVATPGERPTNFFALKFDDSAWKTIPVPSCVELLGYGTPLYINITYPFHKDPPRVTGEPDPSWTMFKERNAVSSYRRNFDLPKAWDGRQTFIVFNGVASAFYLYVNGERVGYSQDSRTPAEFNITQYLKPGKNLVAVEVYRHCDGSYLEDQDMWRLSGIFRDVYLWSAADLDLRDYEIHGSLADDFKTGRLNVTAWTKNYATNAAAYAVDAVLTDAKGKEVTQFTWQGTVAGGAEEKAGAQVQDLNIQPWSAEHPNLYTLRLTLKNAQGKAVAHYASKIGFVRSEIKNGNLLVNGQPILIKGVNRHDTTPTGGYYVSEAEMRADLDAMKRLNINTIRTSHYPNDTRFLELVDEYGFYAISEANIESHGMGYKEETLANNPAWGAAHLDRVRNMVEMVKNHPSVIIYSLGNEAGDGVNFVECSKWVHQRDATRPVQYERAGMGSQYANPGMADYIDLITPMYFPIGKLEGWCREEEKKPLAQQRPLIQCEFNHCMGNSSGGFAEYWRIIRQERLLQGGCIWDWKDQGLLKPQPAPTNGIAAVSKRAPERHVTSDGTLQFFAYGGDFGDKPTDGNFCHNGVVEADLLPKPHAREVAHQYRSILTTGVDLQAAQPKVKVFNEFFFTTLRDQPMRWTLRENGRVRATGELKLAELAPQTATELTIPLPKITRAPGAEYHLDLAYPQVGHRPWAKAGYVIASDQLALDWHTPAASAATAKAGEVTAQENGDTLTLTSPRAVVTLNQRTGQVISYRVGDRELLAQPLALNFWRPPTDNDVGAKMPDRCGLWRDAGAKATVTQASRTQTTNSLSARYELAIPVGTTTASVVYELRADGTLRVALTVHPVGEKLPPIPSISFLGALKPDLREWTWFGRGPEENYSDRCESTFVGLWNGSVDKLWWPYSRPQETANRTDIRWSTFTDASGGGLRVRRDDGQKLEIAAWPFLASDLENLKHPTDLPQRDLIGLRIAHRNMGVGGETSWGMWPRPGHILEAKHEYAFAFVIEPVTTNSTK